MENADREDRLLLATVKKAELKMRIEEREKRKEEKKEQERQVQKEKARKKKEEFLRNRVNMSCLKSELVQIEKELKERYEESYEMLEPAPQLTSSNNTRNSK